MKFVFNDFESSYDYLHGKVIFIALHVNWLKCVPIAIETYKIIYGNGPVYINDFIEVEEILCYTRYNNLPHFKCKNNKIYNSLHSFSSTAAKIWNSLPNALGTNCDINVLNLKFPQKAGDLVIFHLLTIKT